jgi:hypothetical protein
MAVVKSCANAVSYPKYARSQVRCWVWLWRNGMKLSISLAGVRSSNTDTGNWCSSAGITRGNSRIRRVRKQNKNTRSRSISIKSSKLRLFARRQIQVKCYINSDWGFTCDLYIFASYIIWQLANTFVVYM